MDVLFQDQKLEKISDNQSRLSRKYGTLCAKLLTLRLNDLKEAENLEGMRWLPQTRCHELKGDRAGTLALDLAHPYRLIFEPANTPIPRKSDGGLDWTAVTAIRVLGVEDYHD